MLMITFDYTQNPFNYIILFLKIKVSLNQFFV